MTSLIIAADAVGSIRKHATAAYPVRRTTPGLLHDIRICLLFVKSKA